MKFKRLLSLLLASFLLVSCGNAISKEDDKKNLEIFDKSKEYLNTETIEKFQDEKDVNKKLDLVSLEMFFSMFELQSKESNFILSPYSIQKVLKTISDNMSDKENLNFLKFYDTADLGNNFSNSRLDDLILVNHNEVKEVNDGIGNIKVVDFPKGAYNEYEKFQKDIFKDVLDRTPFKNDVVVSIINAIDFMGKWDKKFDANNTENRDFKEVSGKVTKVPTMFGSFTQSNAIVNDKLEAFHLDAGSSRVYFLKFKGNEKPDSEYVYNTLNEIDEDAKGDSTVEFYLPKIDTSSRTDIKPVFNILKIPALLNGFIMDKIYDKSLFVSSAFQVATLKLHERGVEAKAITRVEMLKSSMPEEKNIIVVRMDSPFYIIIRDKSEKNGKSNIIFASYIANPNK